MENQEEKPKKSVRPIVVAGIILWICIIGGGISFTIFSIVNQSSLLALTNPQELALEQVVVALNAQCPVQIDEETQLDSVYLNKAIKQAVYELTLVNTSNEDLDITAVYPELRRTLIEAVAMNADLAGLRNLRYSIKYIYNDMDYVHLCDVLITPEDYEAVINNGQVLDSTGVEPLDNN